MFQMGCCRLLYVRKTKVQSYVFFFLLEEAQNSGFFSSKMFSRERGLEAET